MTHGGQSAARVPMRSPHGTQCRVAAADMSLTSIHNGLRDGSNCGVGVVTSRTRNGFACASVAADEPRERGNRLVPDLCIAIRGQNLDQIGNHIGNADILVTARFARETMKSTLADRRHRIVQSAAKRVRRNVACVMIQKEQAEATHPQIRVAKCGHLNSCDRNLLCEPLSATLRKRGPSMDKVTCGFEARSHHRALVELVGPKCRQWKTRAASGIYRCNNRNWQLPFCCDQRNFCFRRRERKTYARREHFRTRPLSGHRAL